MTHQLVRQYLLHFGYAGTLATFDAAAGLLPGGEAAPEERWTSCCCTVAVSSEKPLCFSATTLTGLLFNGKAASKER